VATAAEAATAGTPLNANLRAGLDAISYDQVVNFTKYVKMVLPLDGFVFWVNANLTPSSTAPLTITAKGSLHYSTRKVQDDSEVYGLSTVIFNSEVPLHQDLSLIGPNEIYIGTIDLITFAFSNRADWYQQAGIYHYSGDATYPFMQSQIINDPAQLLARNAVVSNSLPLWLMLNNYAPFYGFGNSIPLYPSKLIPPNTFPPYGSVQIAPEGTTSIASIPRLSRHSSHYQLSKDVVRIVLTGVDNDAALTFLDCVLQYSQDYNYIGLMNNPLVQDEKVGQSEFGILAMRKRIEFEVSYVQNTARDIARQLILQAIPTVAAQWPTAWIDPYPLSA
jgi:hypothetical protein